MSTTMDTIKTSMQQYLHEIGKFDLLTKEQEKVLFEKIRGGDIEAKNTLICANLRLVVSIAGKYLNRGLDIEDLIQEGNLGLIKAVEKFDPSMNCKFSTYAHRWIEASMSRAALNKGRSVRIPVHKQEKLTRINAFAEKYAKEHGENPSDFVLTEHFPLEDIKDYRTAYKTPLSLDTPVNESSDDTMKELLKEDNHNSVEAQAERNELKEILSELVEEILSEKEKTVIRSRFSDDEKTFKEIGKDLKVSADMVRQYQVKALKKMRMSRKAARLDGYVTHSTFVLRFN